MFQTMKTHLVHADVSVIRVMPNTPMTVGAGICLYTPDSKVTEQQCSILEKLLHSSALCEKVPEYLMDSLGTLTACGPAYVSTLTLSIIILTLVCFVIIHFKVCIVDLIYIFVCYKNYRHVV